MTLSEQHQADVLQHAHVRSDDAPKSVSPARVAIGVVRAGLAITMTALRSRHDVDPIALRPRVLGV